MKVNATKIVETPMTSVSQHRQVSGTLPPSTPVLIAKESPAPEGTVTASHEAGTTTTASAELPKTASGWPLVGMLGFLFLSVSFGLALLRRNMGFRS
jgi:LPXTG-motif cell wall-anchored protein